MAFDVVGVGHCAIDFLGLIPEWPAPDTKIELEQFSVQGGGPVATALVTLANFGVSTTIVGKISDDDFGIFIRQGLREAGVDTSALIIEPQKVSPMSFIAVEAGNARRTIFWTRGNVSPLKAEEINFSLLSGAKVLHVDGLQIEAQLAAATEARKRAVHVVYDAGTFRPGSEELLKLTDTLIASERFAAECSPGPLAESLRRLRDMGPSTVVITLGDEGSVGMENGETYIAPSIEVEALDTTGAGDVYHGAYIYAWLQGWPLRNRMQFANITAGLKCRQLGGRSGIPTLDEVLRFMKETI